jgi:hypothetical protein
MTKFLTRWTRQDPLRLETPAATRREEFRKALGALRKATGKPETRALPCRCASTGRTFDIIFERLSPAQRFQIVRIGQDDAESNLTDKSAGPSARKAIKKSSEADEFDWAGLICPHCGDRSGIVYCGGCEETVCGGRVHPLPDGRRSFACHDACGATGTLVPATHIHGSGAVTASGVGRFPQLPSPSAVRLKRLPQRQPK